MIPLIVAAIVMFAAGLTQGCAGFGMALVAAPFLMMVLPSAVAVPAVVTASMVNTFVVAIESRRHISAKIIAPLFVGGFMGAQLGVHALQMIDDVPLKVGVGAFIVFASCALLSGLRVPLGDGPWVKIPVGVVGGFCGGSTSMGGPPVVLFLANQRTPKDIFRANLVCYFFLVNCVSVATYSIRGMFTIDVAKVVAASMVTMLLGTYVGVKLAKHVPEKRFRQVVMSLVGVTGLILFATNLRTLLQAH
ncbi:MAG: sulfite exporter TauE/SafE family protein [bacterium]|nr:sulfite exporter TauE/SafE family protein [bacterium]